MDLLGFDFSVDQGAIDWNAVAEARKTVFAFGKATEGLTYVDANFRTNHDGAKAAGFPIGAYHFFHFGDDGLAQAEKFLSVVDGYEGPLLPMVDVELDGADGETDIPSMMRNLGAFLARVDATLRGKRTLIYFDWAFWVYNLGGYGGFSGHPAWVAAYNNGATFDMTGTGWHDWTLWQYTDQLAVPGITVPCDGDRLQGALSLIQR